MRLSHRIKDSLYSAGLAACGVILYIPAAVGLAVAELARRPEPDDNRWRFVLPGSDQCLSVTAKKNDLWAHMNFAQYFSLIPGVTAVSSENCAFSRPAYAF
jgi:hypothetical protein